MTVGRTGGAVRPGRAGAGDTSDPSLPCRSVGPSHRHSCRPPHVSPGAPACRPRHRPLRLHWRHLGRPWPAFISPFSRYDQLTAQSLTSATRGRESDEPLRQTLGQMTYIELHRSCVDPIPELSRRGTGPGSLASPGQPDSVFVAIQTALTHTAVHLRNRAAATRRRFVTNTRNPK